MPTKATTTPTPTPAPAPTPVPVPPTSWTVSSIIVYVVACVLFLLGVLTQAGVTVPASVSTEVRIWAGVANEIASALTVLAGHITNSNVVKYLAALGSS